MERLFDRYVIHDEIACGGMATVHLGRQLGPVGFSRTVAIKRLHAHFARDPKLVAMFVDEARLAGRLSHPNIVATIDVVQRAGELFLIMEHVHGESLARLLERSGREGRPPCSPAVAAAIVSDVLYGLHAAHEARSETGELLNIVHRDVAPKNVLVGADGSARVCDFGIAKARGRLQTTSEGTLKGTLPYFAPEQAMGAPMDRRTDVYAAGVTLWEALVGRHLCDGATEAEILLKVISPDRPAPSTERPGLPGVLDPIVLRALAHAPEERYPTARDMALDIERAIRCASRAEVAEWVSAAAGAELAERAARLREIERAPLAKPEPGERVLIAPEPVGAEPVASAPVAPVADASDPRGAAAATAVGTGEVSLPLVRRGRTFGWIAAGAAAAGLVAVALVAAGPRTPGSDASPAGSAQGPSSTRSASGHGDADVADAAGARRDPLPEATGTGAPETPPPRGVPGGRSAAVPPSTARPTPPAPPSQAPSPTAAPIEPARTALPAPRCDPPFTIDAEGVQHLKPECL